MKAKKSFLAMLLASVMLVCAMPCTAFAQNSSSDTDYGIISVADMSNFELLDDSVMTREEAIQMLGLTEEEAEQVTFYTCEVGVDSSEKATRSIETLNSGDVKAYDLTFSTYNRGLDRVFKGNQMKWGCRLVSTTGSGVSVMRCSYDVPDGYEVMDLTPGYYDTQSTTWFSIYYGGTYYWKYYGYGNGTEYGPHLHTLRLVIAIL